MDYANSELRRGAQSRGETGTSEVESWRQSVGRITTVVVAGYPPRSKGADSR